MSAEKCRHANDSYARLGGAAMLFATALVGGCIVSDQFTTITIHPDGSADLTRFQTDIHPSATGANAEEELRRFVADFDARHDPDLLRIEESGGEIIESRWVRQEVPSSTVVAARLPDVAALEKFCTLRGELGETLVEGRFTQDDHRFRPQKGLNNLRIGVDKPPDLVESLGPEDVGCHERLGGLLKHYEPKAA